MRGLISAVLLLAVVGTAELLAQSSGYIPPLSKGAVIAAVQLDPAGNIIVAGTVPPANPQSAKDTSDGFVAKLSPDGSQILYWTLLSGNGADQVHALALGPDGSAYVTGQTSSTNFPTTSRALQTSTGASIQAFAVKLDPNGAVQYATLIGSSSATEGWFLAVNTKGEAVVAGDGGAQSFFSTPSPFGSYSGMFNEGFLIKLDAAGRTAIFVIQVPGYGPVALDAQDNIYLAAVAYDPTQVRTTPGAFQSSAYFLIPCGGGELPGAPETLCPSQYVAKISPDGTALAYATYITGGSGAQPSAIAVDSAGNAYVGGTTNSSDYPVTAGSFEAVDPASAPPPQIFLYYSPPTETGYVTKLNSQGTGLIWSTFFGGTWMDSVSSMAVDANGNVYLAGTSASSDLPGTSAVAQPCRPSASQAVPFVTRLSSDGTSIAGTRLLQGLPSAPVFDLYSLGLPVPFPVFAVGPNGAITAAAGDTLVTSVDLSASPGACFADAADYSPITRVAPGELVSIFNASVESQTAVTFNGIAAPVLYASPQAPNSDGTYEIAELNVQAPYEIAGASTVNVQIGTESHTLLVVPLAPSAFLVPGASLVCGQTVAYGAVPVARNEDGSLNSCLNPAYPGTTVTIFLNGLGATNPPLPTGSINPLTPIPLSLTVSDPTATVVSAVAAPGQPSGVWQVGFAMPALAPGAYLNDHPVILQPKINGVPLLEPQLAVWSF